MQNIGKSLQCILDERFYIYRPKIINVAKSLDGTLKFLLELTDGNTIETVFIPEEKRTTVCVSSQVGCPLGCKFCNTGAGGFVRNLSAEEIVSQFLVVKDYLGTWSSDERISNIVFMGMGEPLLNHENVLKAIDNLMADDDEGISRRRITISTSGIANVLRDIAKDLKCRLAISLHAPNDEIRSSIMPINNRFKIKDIMEACSFYSQQNKNLRITFEYLLLNGINDSKECALELIKLLNGFNCKVNLLQFNSWDGCSFRESSKNKTIAFAKTLKNGGIEAPIRFRRGEDIMGACGQLRGNQAPKPCAEN
jgi:23S rRNA (adenine2503-C2)-methyltransferase